MKQLKSNPSVSNPNVSIGVDGELPFEPLFDFVFIENNSKFLR